MGPKTRKDNKRLSTANIGVAGGESKGSTGDKRSILTYAEGRGEVQTNFLACKEAWSIELKELYGNAGRLLELDKHYVPADIPPPGSIEAKTPEQKATNEMNVEMWKEECKLRLREIRNLQCDYPKMYAYIWNRMSTESRAKVRTTKGWDNVERDNCPLGLWGAIKLTHMAATSASAENDRQRARAAYGAIRQYATETVAELKKRVDDVMLLFDAVKQARPTDEEQAADFLAKLDGNRFSTLKVHLENQRLLGIDCYPKNLTDAYNLAVNWKVPKASGGGERSGGVIPAAAIYAADTKKSRNQNGKSKSNAEASDRKSEAKDSGGRGMQKGASASGGKPAEEADTLECWGCGERGHRLRDCPEVARRREEHRAGSKKVGNHCTVVTSEVPVGDLVAFATGDSKSGGMPPLEKWEVGLDTMATDHVVMAPELCANIWRCPYEIEITGIGGTVTTALEGEMPGFGTVNLHPDGTINLLSFARVLDECDVVFDRDAQVFHVHTGGETFLFGRRGNLFVCDMSRLWDASASQSHRALAYVETVSGNEMLYSKRHVARAKRAKALIEELGFVSTQDLIKMVKGGIPGCDVNVADVYRALKIYGPSLGALRGKTKKSKVEPVILEPVPKAIDVSVELHVDIMFVERIPFLVCVVQPMSYTMVQLLGSRTEAEVRKAMMAFIGKTRAEGFEVRGVLTDGEGAVAALTTDLQLMGILVNPTGAGSHVAVVERKIGVTKGRVRGHLNTLPFALCVSLVVWLVFYCVSRLNLIPTSTTSAENVSPREAFTGTRIDYKRDLGLKFGDYCETHESYQETNTMASRTRPSIAVLPRGNKQGSWTFIALDTFRPIVRDHWTKLPLPDWVIDHLNKKAEAGKRHIGQDPVFRRGHTVVAEPYDDEDAVVPLPRSKPVEHVSDSDDGQPIPDELLNVQRNVEASMDELTGGDAPLRSAMITGSEPLPGEGVQLADDSVCVEPSASAMSERVSAVEQSGSDEETHMLQQEPARVHVADQPSSALIPDVISPESTTEQTTFVDGGGRMLRANRRYGHRDGYWREKFNYHMSVKQALKSYGDKAVGSLCKEMLQMHEKGVWQGVHFSSLTDAERRGIIRSRMFLKMKYLSTGEEDKLKARLVAGGNMQDRSIYTAADTSSPTVDLQSFYMIAAIAARERRVVVTADIGGAYLNADMQKEVYMRLDSKLAEVLVALEPEYEQFMCKDGSMVVKLRKALYGCVESAKLWYQNFSGYLKELGFEANPKDHCVFNMTGSSGDQLTVCVYVDDLLITCKSSADIEDLLTKLKDKYKEITISRGDFHSYLGQSIEFCCDGQVKISMEGYIRDLLDSMNVDASASSPATVKLFVVDETSTALETEQKELYHSCVARLLYLAKRARPDLLTAVAFLCTRVQAPTVDDWNKLERIVKYLNGTKDLGVKMNADADMTVRAYIDASYGVHQDMKSHTGGVISLGRGPVYVTSAKQKLMSKSSTEAELIGVSDVLSQVIWTRDFLLAQGYDVGPAKLYQDNESTIVLAEKGYSTNSKTRHIAIRYFFVKDRIDAGEVALEHLPTEQMLADLLTKPLQGTLFRKLRSELLNWE